MTAHCPGFEVVARGACAVVADCPGGGPETGSLSDALAISGPHDRRSSHGVLDEAQELMADAVGAAHFTPLTPPTCVPPHTWTSRLRTGCA
ncbi:hypothetical protein ACFYOD_02590 [Streptomyces sp. NPDC006703]|uniref:hypothetical protein n=1 Tax=Streptomyces sp. NPDC006703 TaxID=3364759 RepID=UPI0036BFE333